MIIDIVITTTGILTNIILGIITITLHTSAVMTVLTVIIIVMLRIPAHTDWCKMKRNHSFHAVCVNVCAWVQVYMQTEHPCSRATAHVPLQQPAQHAHRP